MDNKNNYKEIINKLVTMHNELINAISRYHFDYKYRNSYGYNQNINNRNILIELDSFSPMFNLIKYNLDIYFKYSNLNNEYTNRLINKINEMINKLDKARIDLNIQESTYHFIWNMVIYNDGHWTLNDLGKKKNEWKKAKNKACHTLLSFYKELFMINKSLPLDKSIKNEKYINAGYNIALSDIMNGPNYYSYLNDKEREENISKNKLIKQKFKNNHKK